MTLPCSHRPRASPTAGGFATPSLGALAVVSAGSLLLVLAGCGSDDSHSEALPSGVDISDSAASTPDIVETSDSSRRSSARHDAVGGPSVDTVVLDAQAVESDTGAVGPCVGKPNGKPCDDGDPCSVGDSCKGEVCAKGKTLLDCDDNDPCTEDGCHPELACWHEKGPQACDDGNPCTHDSCDATAGCGHQPLDPGDNCATDACMIGQKCSASLLCLGGVKKNCEDDNPCTHDSCHPKTGCLFKLNSNTCSDGHACTIDDSCNGGTCVGKKTNACPVCNNQFGPWVSQLNEVLLGTDGKSGNGLDIDGDKKTCAPAGACEKGVDNSMAGLSFAVNKPLQAAMKAGTMRFLVEMAGYQGEGKTFSLRIYYGNLAPGSKGCDWLSQSCAWLVTQQSMGPDCKPLASFDNAVIVDGKLTAGGASEVFALEANLAGSVKPTFYIKGATIAADVAFAKGAGVGKPKIASLDGVIAGAMTEAAVMAVVNALPESNFKPLDKKSALKLVKQLLVLDIDVDGDGVKDAASLGIRIKGLGGSILGMSL